MKNFIKAISYTFLIILSIYLFFAFWFIVLPLILFFIIWIMVSENSNSKEIIKEDETEEFDTEVINDNMEEIYIENFESEDDDVKELMESHLIEKDEAEEIMEIMEEFGVDEEDAISIKEAGV